MEGLPRYVRERLDIATAMSETPSAPDSNNIDLIPAVELAGILAVHCTVSRLTHKGKLSKAAGCFLNATLCTHCFSIVHHCTHESISQANEEHAAFENMVFRLGASLIFFDDGYREGHRYVL